jgi:hypothetical protein
MRHTRWMARETNAVGSSRSRTSGRQARPSANRRSGAAESRGRAQCATPGVGLHFASRNQHFALLPHPPCRFYGAIACLCVIFDRLASAVPLGRKRCIGERERERERERESERTPLWQSTHFRHSSHAMANQRHSAHQRRLAPEQVGARERSVVCIVVPPTSIVTK